MPAVLAYVAVGLAGLIIAGALVANILSHLDGTAASEAYSKSLLQREQSLLNLTKAGVPFDKAAGQLGPPPKQPKGIGFGGVSLYLIGGGIALALGAIFWKPLARLVGLRSANLGGDA